MSTSNTKTPGPLDNDEMLLVLQQSLTKKRVLIIDRHTQARDALRLMLGALGVTAVHGAGNSAEVLRQVKANRFDLVLSDFVLDDGRDGQQLLEELRHAHLIQLSTVYLIITSERSKTNVVALAELAPDDYLIKPFTAEQLQARLIKAIYKKYVLRKIYEHLERGALEEAIDACDRVIQQQPCTCTTPCASRVKSPTSWAGRRKPRRFSAGCWKAGSCPGQKWGWRWRCATAGRWMRRRGWPSR